MSNLTTDPVSFTETFGCTPVAGDPLPKGADEYNAAAPSESEKAARKRWIVADEAYDNGSAGLVIVT